jgi:3',5'-cyclic AMP phosphodiesterase CpdA
MIRIAHLSDVHLPLAPGLPRPLSLLANKRLLGFASWHVRRKLVHRVELVEALMSDVAAATPDQIAITGDLINISLPDEFERALAWLRTVGPPDRVVVVPGNHDAQIAKDWQRSVGRWTSYLSDMGEDKVVFPTVRKRGNAAFIGLSSALPTRWFSANGQLGDTQIAELERQLHALKGLFRVVLVHHPPFPLPRHARKQLVDWAALRQTLGRAGAELILHGHMHCFAATPIGAGITAFGVPSASSARRGTGRAGWNLYEIAREGTGWRIDVHSRELASDGKRFQTRTVQRLRSRT